MPLIIPRRNVEQGQIFIISAHEYDDYRIQEIMQGIVAFDLDGEYSAYWTSLATPEQRNISMEDHAKSFVEWLISVGKAKPLSYWEINIK
jgi:hypothetical protein